MTHDTHSTFEISREEVVEVARDLIAIPSITHQEGSGMVEYFTKWFSSLGIETKAYPYDDNRANFVASWGSGKGRFMVNGHQDVKPTTGMTVDPFAGLVENGRLYGRGACDMKGPIAALLCAIKATVKAGVTPNATITFFSDLEEEYGGGAGWQWAKEFGLFDGYEGLLSCEPSELAIHIGNRGCYMTAFEAIGRSAHSGLASRGVNAVQNMARFISEFLELDYLRVENPHFGKPTVNFERIEGGLYLSAVPDSCIACVDSRLIPETPPEMVQEQVESLCRRLANEKIEIRETDEPTHWRAGPMKMPAESIPADHPVVSTLQRATEQITGASAAISGCPGLTIAGTTIPLGVPTVIFGPGSIAQAHTADEWVSIDELETAASVYAEFISRL